MFNYKLIKEQAEGAERLKMSEDCEVCDERFGPCDKCDEEERLYQSFKKRIIEDLLVDVPCSQAYGKLIEQSSTVYEKLVEQSKVNE